MLHDPSINNPSVSTDGAKSTLLFINVNPLYVLSVIIVRNRFPLTAAWATVQEICRHFSFAFDFDNSSAFKWVVIGMEDLMEVTGNL